MKIGGFQKCSLIDFPGKISAVIFTNGCNFACPWCHNGNLINTKDDFELISEKEILGFLKSKQTFLEGVTISGGEPTIQAGLTRFLNKLRTLPFSIKLDTNGYNSAKLRDIVNAKLVDYIAMDIKSPLNYKYSLLTNKSIDTDIIKESIQIIRNSGIDYEFRTTFVAGLLDFSDLDLIRQQMSPDDRWIIQEFKPDKSFNKDLILKYYPENFSWLSLKDSLAESKLEKFVLR